MGWVNHSSDINTLIDENEEFADFFDEIESDFLDGDYDDKTYEVPAFIIAHMELPTNAREIRFTKDGNDVNVRFN